MAVRINRVYAEAECADGLRVLVDRLWPRGLSKIDARIDLWAREAAPSSELRRWFGHDPTKWKEFRHRYLAELASRPQDLTSLTDAVSHCTVTLLYAARDTLHNHALVLKSYLDAQYPEAPADGDTA
jgi:uncharacterized protein YeaO (DUF488 family)